MPNDAELDSPLLGNNKNSTSFAADDDENDNNNNSSNNNATTSANKGVMLHGESVDLRHFLLSSLVGSPEETAAPAVLLPFASTTNGPTATTNNNNNNSNHNGGNNAQECKNGTLSLEEQSTSSLYCRTSKSFVENLMTLPRRGHVYFLKARSRVAKIVSSSRGWSTMASSSRSSNSNNCGDVNSNNNRPRSNMNRNNNNNNNNNKKKQLTQKSSLSLSPSTPLLLKFLLPPLLLANHILFYHAQTKPMWNLSTQTNISISGTASSLKTKTAFDALNLPHRYTYTNKEHTVVQTFTYMDAIRKLWNAEGLGDAATMSRIAAGLLVVFSGIWPHLKLILMHGCWFWNFCHSIVVGNGSGGGRSGGGGRGYDNDNGGSNNECRRDDDDDDDDGNEDEYEEIVGRGRNGRNNAKSKICSIIPSWCCTTKNNNNSSSNNITTNANSSHDNCFAKCCYSCSTGPTHHQTNTLRSPFLRTLSTLGKWSLADVLVVCILIAVLHLDWNLHPDELRAGIEKELPKILSYIQSNYPDVVQNCIKLLGYTCGKHALVYHFPACLACQAAIGGAYSHPEWATSEGKDIIDGIALEGGGSAQLRVVGMVGTYYFCGAVIMSILLSLVVDWMDEWDRGRVETILLEKKKQLMEEEEETLRNGGIEEEVGTEGVNDLELREEGGLLSSPLALNNALLLDHPSTPSQNNYPHHRHRRNLSTPSAYGFSNRSIVSVDTRPPLPSPTTNFRLLKQTLNIVFSVASLPLVYFAITLPTMQRLVYGGVSTLLHEVLGMVWTKEYNMISLVKTTGDAGGWDTLLMATFGMFVVIGPILRSICLILHVALGLPLALLGDCIERPRHRTTLRLVSYQVTTAFQKGLLPIIDALGAFCAWEVLIVALIMIQLEMPNITDTIYKDDRCLEADPDHGRTCIEVQFNALDNFYVVGVAWFVLIVASWMTVNLAASSEEKNLLKEEARYEYGQSIPKRHQSSGISGGTSSRGSYRGASSGGNDCIENEHQYLPVLQQNQEDEEETKDGLEEIVFL